MDLPFNKQAGSVAIAKCVIKKITFIYPTNHLLSNYYEPSTMLGKQDKEKTSGPCLPGVSTPAQADGIYYLKYNVKGIHGVLRGSPNRCIKAIPGWELLGRERSLKISHSCLKGVVLNRTVILAKGTT